MKFRIMLRGTVNRLALGISLVLISFSSPLKAIEDCATGLSTLTPHLKNYSQEKYEESFRRWKHFFREISDQNEEILLTELKTNHPASIESLIALGDAINPNYDWSISRHLNRFPQLGLTVDFQTADVSEVVTRLSYSKRSLKVKWPKEGTQSLGQILRNLRAFSRSIADFYTISVARKGEFFRLPFSKDTRTYASRVADAYTQGELHFYSVVYGFKNQFPQYAVEWEATKDTLSEKAPNSYMRRILMLLFKSNYQFYLKHVWNQTDYEAFEKLLEDARTHEKNLFEVEAGYRKQVIAPRIFAHAQVAQNHRTWRPIVIALALAVAAGSSWTYTALNPPFEDPLPKITQGGFQPYDVEQAINDKNDLLSNDDRKTLQSLLEMWKGDSSGIKRAVIENQISQIFEAAEKRALQQRPAPKPKNADPQTQFDAPLK